MNNDRLRQEIDAILQHMENSEKEPPCDPEWLPRYREPLAGGTAKTRSAWKSPGTPWTAQKAPTDVSEQPQNSRGNDRFRISQERIQK